jgi:hypothetical protein
MKPEDKKALYISIAMILFLGFMIFWRIKNFEKPQIQIPVSKENSEIPSFSDFFSEEGINNFIKEGWIDIEESEKEIIYIRENIEDVLKFDYPSSWEKIPSNDLEKPNNKIATLFAAYSQKSFYPKTIIVLKVEAESIEDLSYVLEENIVNNKENIEIIIEEKEDLEYSVEIKDSTSDGSAYLSKAFSLDNYYYIFIISYFEEEPTLSIVDYIFSSVQIIR